MPNLGKTKHQSAINNRFPASLPEPWLNQWNDLLEAQTANERVFWAMENLPSQFVLSNSS